MMYFLGCDVAKAKIDMSLIDDTGQEIFASTVSNNHEDITVHLLTIAGHYVGADDRLQVVVESTGRFHCPTAEAALAVGISCRIYNPILTKQAIKQSVRGKKTDKADALVIARMGLRGEGRIYTEEPYLSTKYYSRGQQKLSEFATSLKLFETHLADALGGELSYASRGALGAIQAQLKAARAQLVLDTAASAPAELMQRLRTIPGVGPFIAASLIGEIQDMARFRKAKQLIAYVGLDPKIRQSGHSLKSIGRLTKRGSPHLRRSVFIAANVSRRFDPYCKAYYEKKRAEGKSYKVATCALARKLLLIVRAVWLSGGSYDADFWQQDSLPT